MSSIIAYMEIFMVGSLITYLNDSRTSTNYFGNYKGAFYRIQIEEAPKFHANHTHFNAKVISISETKFKPMFWKNTIGSILVWIKIDSTQFFHENLQEGDQIIFQRQPKPIKAYSKSKDFNFASYENHQGVFFEIFLHNGDYTKAPFESTQHSTQYLTKHTTQESIQDSALDSIQHSTQDSVLDSPFDFRKVLVKLKKLLTNKLESSCLKPEVKGTLESVLLGDKSKIPYQDMISIRKIGFLNIFSSSAIQLGLVWGIILSIFLKVREFIQWVYRKMSLKLYRNKNLLQDEIEFTKGEFQAQINWKIFTQRWIYILAFALLYLYASLIGFTPSITRGMVLLGLYTLAKLTGRLNDRSQMLASACLVQLVMAPNTLFDLGFQLSYSALFSLVKFYDIFRIRFPFRNPVLRWLSRGILGSLAIQMGILPLSIYYFHNYSIYFIFKGLISFPLACIVFYLGFIYLSIMFIAIPSSSMTRSIIWIKERLLSNIEAILYWIETIIRKIGNLPNNIITGIYLRDYEFMAFIVIVFSLYGYLKFNRIKYVYILLGISFFLIVARTIIK